MRDWAETTKILTDLFVLAEEEWIEEQLAINPDFDPNDEANAAEGATDEQQSQLQPSATTGATAQNATSDHVDQTGEGTLVEGENKTPEAKPKPKRYVIRKNSLGFFH